MKEIFSRLQNERTEKMSMSKRQIRFICLRTAIKNQKSSVSEMDSANSAKRSGELSEFSFDGMDIFQH